jgi:GxxExxY protein
VNVRLSEVVIGCAIEVSRQLGHGFLERVYEGAFALELSANGIAFQRQRELPVLYRGQIVGDYVCDFIVEGQLLVELKALAALTREHEAQLLNYLKASDLTAGLLLNFGTPKLGIRRLVLQHDDAHAI